MTVTLEFKLAMEAKLRAHLKASGRAVEAYVLSAAAGTVLPAAKNRQAPDQRAVFEAWFSRRFPIPPVSDDAIRHKAVYEDQV